MADNERVVTILTLNDVRTKYDTNEKALALLLKSEIMGFTLQCPCGASTFNIQTTNRTKYRKDGHMYVCPICSKTRTIRLGSIFYGSTNTLQQICDIIYSFAVLHSDQTLNADLVNSSIDNSGKWFMVIRYCIKLWFADNPIQLGLFGIKVEIDETCMTTQKKYGVGSVSSEARWVLGLNERGPRQRHIYLGKHRTREVVIPVILLYVVMMAFILTDNFTVYWILGDIGYQHAMVNHSIEFVNEYDPEIHTETVEGGFKHLKQDLNRASGVRTKYLQLYLDEHDFRTMYLRRNKPKAWFIVARLLGEYGHQALDWLTNLNDHHY